MTGQAMPPGCWRGTLRLKKDEAHRREWAAKPPEERIAGKLQFWLLGQQRKGRELSSAEIAAKRAALLAELDGLTGAADPIR